MRMMVISFVVILILIFVWIWFHQSSIEVVTSYYLENLTELGNTINIDDWDKARIDIVKYCNKWEKSKIPWIYFLNQKDIDNIDVSFAKIDIYIENTNKTMAQAELEQLKGYFNAIKANECMTWDNIF
jgi:hypothetical protein